MLKSQKQKSYQQGFTILELTAVIAIITFGMIGMLSLAMMSIKAQYINRNNLTASMLAQEGLELVRNYRDNFWVYGGNTWENLLQNGNYIIDYTSSGLTSVSDINNLNTQLKINATGFFEHTNGNLSNFRRMITISGTAAGTASSTVTCRVRYSANNNDYDYVAETVLYDWK